MVVHNGHEENTYGPESKSDVTLHLAGGSVEWMIDVIGNISGKDPVVGAIAEKITNRHRCVRETMDKERFQDSFSIMRYPANSCNAVNWFKMVNKKNRGKKLFTKLTELFDLLVGWLHHLHKIAKVLCKSTHTQTEDQHIQPKIQFSMQFEAPSPEGQKC